MTAGTDEVAAGAAGGAAKRAPRPTVHWTADGRADVLRLFDQGALVHVAAPMVRYSKLPFRQLVRLYDVDLVYSPMIMADSFVSSAKARDTEFTTNAGDCPLVVQFGARTAADFAAAAELVARHCDAVDLNCGCPQAWAMQGGYGAQLLKSPELVRDMVRQARSRTGNLPVSIKIRVDKDLSHTVRLAQMAEAVGVSWITVHGRTPRQRSSTPPDLDAIKLVRENVNVPVIANGDIFSLADAHAVQAKTGVHGAMAARGLLENPALFAGHAVTPRECLADYLGIATSLGTPFKTFLYHVGTMAERGMSVGDRKALHSGRSVPAVLDFLEDHYGIRPQLRPPPLRRPAPDQ